MDNALIKTWHGATICALCNLRSFVDGKAGCLFNETPLQHEQRLHPDPVQFALDLHELEHRASHMFPTVTFRIDDHEFN